jgi:hypothetical protein
MNTEESNTDSSPVPSSPPRTAVRKPESKRTEAVTQSEADIYRTIILQKKNRYDHLCRNRPLDREMLDEIVDLTQVHSIFHGLRLGCCDERIY